MKSYVQVYTGNGKGKTTASLGLAIRALGNDWTVLLCQFMKGQNYGELKSLASFQNMTIRRFGTGNFIRRLENVQDIDRKLARKGYLFLKEALRSGEYSLVIADEIFVARRFELISTEEILELMSLKSEKTELILTGRHAPEEIMEKADLVTEMREIKHYLKQGVKAREGIER
ncbi:cob(I)yrinic acid a,c-diamide adenosyltransferase [Fusobacterium necrophorum]|uniref:cob(I)yrinic acid a,c-diamide adenosyltransferase n=1 Tax=Fusobacterium necrophorum TaxID=859 RepID=UPI00078692FE|nr:cob(I)yrinic acid a,c-diamide adenosyltransferase [Fusobacterium necrophorum]KYM42076.1 cob(I)yrinic acid a,c-diamide adenosyltransferase [Fusobacterium necrophorum subsp. funduliforme]